MGALNGRGRRGLAGRWRTFLATYGQAHPNMAAAVCVAEKAGLDPARVCLVSLSGPEMEDFPKLWFEEAGEGQFSCATPRGTQGWQYQVEPRGAAVAGAIR